MDFEKINAMIDELNKNFDIIEDKTRELEAQKMEDYKELFWNTHKYFQNVYKLLEKVRIYSHDAVCFRTHKATDYKEITINFGKGYANLEFGGRRLGQPTISLLCPSMIYFEREVFKGATFTEKIIPTIKTIDWEYLEQQIADKLNKAITEKAESIERKYNKAQSR